MLKQQCDTCEKTKEEGVHIRSTLPKEFASVLAERYPRDYFPLERRGQKRKASTSHKRTYI